LKKQGKPIKPPAKQPQNERSLTNPHGSTGPKNIPIEKILACRAKGLTQEETAKLVGCSIENIQKRTKDLDLDTLDDFNVHKVNMYDLVERKHLTKLVDGESKRPMEDMTVSAIAGDKGRVIRGQATDIIDHRVLTLDLNKAIEQLRQEQGIDTIDVDNSMDIPVHKCPNGG